MSRILALDTATNACSAALWIEDQVAAGRYELMERGHAERLMPMVAEIAAEADCNLKDVDLVAVTVGPGAFTGLRVGLAAARALALAADGPCLGLTTLEVMADAVGSDDAPVLVALDSKRADLYVQLFNDAGQALSDAEAVLPEALPDWSARALPDGGELVTAGNAADVVAQALSTCNIHCRDSGVLFPDAANLARMAAERWSPGSEVPRPTPVYLRPPDAAIPAHGGRLRP